MIWPFSTIRRLTIENWQLRAALGYPIPSRLERDVEPNPFKCGMCDARYRNPQLFADEAWSKMAPMPGPLLAELVRQWEQGDRSDPILRGVLVRAGVPSERLDAPRRAGQPEAKS